MKHGFQKETIEKAYKRFHELRSDERYMLDYAKIVSLEREIKRLQNDRLHLIKDRKAQKDLLRLKVERVKILRCWDLKIAVNPKWKITKERLMRAFQPGDTVSKFLWALLGGPLNNYVKKFLKKSVSVAKERIEMEDRQKKMLCYSLEKAGMKIRPLARILKVDNKTIHNWLDEVEEWSRSDRELVLCEISSSKSMFRKKDALDRFTVSYREEL